MEIHAWVNDGTFNWHSGRWSGTQVLCVGGSREEEEESKFEGRKTSSEPLRNWRNLNTKLEMETKDLLTPRGECPNSVFISSICGYDLYRETSKLASLSGFSGDFHFSLQACEKLQTLYFLSPLLFVCFSHAGTVSLSLILWFLLAGGSADLQPLSLSPHRRWPGSAPPGGSFMDHYCLMFYNLQYLEMDSCLLFISSACSLKNESVSAHNKDLPVSHVLWMNFREEPCWMCPVGSGKALNISSTESIRREYEWVKAVATV